MRNMRYETLHNRILCGTVALAALLALLFLVVLSYEVTAPFLTRDSVTVTVTDKERITEGSGDSMRSRYLVFTAEGEVFENTDTIALWKFNSSDIQGSLMVDSRYELRVYGFRVPFLSMYRNIISVEPLPQEM